MTGAPFEGVEIKPCPFCGASATIEELSDGPLGIRFSVGCDSETEADCMGYQSFTSFNRRGEAIAAWNKRDPAKNHEGQG